MYDELDSMVLNCYNATLMDIGAEANLFRSVPSSPKQAPDTDYTLDVHFTPVSRLIPLVAVMLEVSFLIATVGLTCTSPTVVLVCACVFW